MLMRFFSIFSAWIASLNIPALSQSLKKEVEMWEVVASGVQKGHFAVLVELHSDLAKWLALSNADGAHWQLCSRRALTQHCSTHTSPKALTLPLGLLLSCHPTGTEGNRTWDRPLLRRERMLAKLPNPNCSQPFTQVLGFLVHYISHSVQCSASFSLHHWLCYAILCYAILYYTILYFLNIFNCSF